MPIRIRFGITFGNSFRVESAPPSIQEMPRRCTRNVEMSLFSGFSSIFRTTLLDQSRDRRSMGAAFIYALLGPVVMLLAFDGMAKNKEGGQAMKLAVYGAEGAPRLINELQQGAVRIERRTGGNPKEFGDADAVLLIPANFDRQLAAGRTGTVTLYRNERQQQSSLGAALLRESIEKYGDELGRSRLTERGLVPGLAEPIELTEENIAPVSARAVMLVNMMLYFFILAPFFTSMTAAIDATAGERERSR